MASLSLREIPPELHGWLKHSAARHGRSINAEILWILDGARRSAAEIEARKARIDAVREQYLPGVGTPGSDLIRTIRSDRSR